VPVKSKVFLPLFSKGTIQKASVINYIELRKYMLTVMDPEICSSTSPKWVNSDWWWENF